MVIYLVEHSRNEFTGFYGGVDFHHGRGTTSSASDAKRLAGLGCSVSELGTKSDTLREGSKGPSLTFTPTDEEKKAAEANEEAREKQDKLERNPDSEWSKKRKEQAKARAGRKGGRS